MLVRMSRRQGLGGNRAPPSPAGKRADQIKTMKLSPLTLIAGIFLATVLKSAGQPATNVTFTRITTGPIVTNVASSVGATWVDIDGDGNLDLFVSNADGPNLLFRNEGNGVFTRITNGPPVNIGPGFVQCLMGGLRQRRAH